MHVYVHIEVRDQCWLFSLFIYLKWEGHQLTEDNSEESGLSFHLSKHSGLRFRSPNY